MNSVANLEDARVSTDEVDSIVKETIDGNLKNASFLQSKAGQWTSAIAEGCLKSLGALSKPYKYIGTAIGKSGYISEKNIVFLLYFCQNST